MLPKNIWIVRHGQSEGNVDREVSSRKPDYALNLTEKGWKQADERGLALRQLIGNESVQWYVSPYFRTRQTYIGIRRHFDHANHGQHPSFFYEDPRLREQEWGNLRKGVDYNKLEQERDAFGHFYYRLPGEACSDVFDRISDFLNTFYRDTKRNTFPQNAVFVNHGLTARIILMRWFHLSVEEFERLANPENCGMYHLQLGENEKYTLIGEPKRYEHSKHKNQFVWPVGGSVNLGKK